MKLEVKPICQVCASSQNLNIHHKHYSSMGGEKVTDLVTLCSSCHRLTHKYFGVGVKKLNKKFCRVRRLLELGASKSKAFWVVADPNLYDAVIEKVSPR